MDREQLNARRAELIRIVEAIDGVLKEKNWHVLREYVFDKLEESLTRQLLAEAKSSNVEVSKLHTLQGELANAKRYDLATYAEKCKKELEGIKLNLQ